MLLAEDPLPLLLEQLERMPPGDRRAILARLSRDDRRRLERHRRDRTGSAQAHGEAAAPPAFSDEVGSRVASIRTGADGGMTPATRELLRRLLGVAAPDAAQARPKPGATSLMGSLGGMLRGRPAS